MADVVSENSKTLKSALPAVSEPKVQRTDRPMITKGQIGDAADTLRKVINNEEGYAGLADAMKNKLTSEYVIQGLGAAGGAALGLLLSGLIHRKPNWLLRMLYAAGGGAAGWFGSEALMDPANMRLEAWKKTLGDKERSEIEKAVDTMHNAPDSPGQNWLAWLPQTKTQGVMNALILLAGGNVGARASLHRHSNLPTPRPPASPMIVGKASPAVQQLATTTANAPKSGLERVWTKTKQVAKPVGKVLDPFSGVRTRDMQFEPQPHRIIKTPRQYKAYQGIKGGITGMLTATGLAALGNFLANYNSAQREQKYL